MCSSVVYNRVASKDNNAMKGDVLMRGIDGICSTLLGILEAPLLPVKGHGTHCLAQTDVETEWDLTRIYIYLLPLHIYSFLSICRIVYIRNYRTHCFGYLEKNTYQTTTCQVFLLHRHRRINEGSLVYPTGRDAVCQLYPP